MNIRELIGEKILVLDGALGTALQSAGLKGGELSESFNFEHPETVKKIYGDYISAGSNIISTNTFSSNSRKLSGQPFDVTKSISQAVKLAKEAAQVASESGKKVYVAHDMGPTGELMKPMGNLDFDSAYELFKEQVVAGKKAGADLHLFETFSDITELRAGIIAATENSDLPVFCTVTFEEDGHMLMGTDPETAVFMLQDMGIDAIGINCSLGPAETAPLIKRMLAVSKIPVMVQPNAGMPRVDGDETLYDVTPEEFAERMVEMIKAGIAVAGGCCGTTPEHILALTKRLEEVSKDDLPGISGDRYEKKINASRPSACTPTKTVLFENETIIIGERINPTGKKNLKEALRSQNYDYVINEALDQENSGADIININIGMEDIDAKKTMKELVEIVSETVDSPLMIDSSDPDVIEKGIREYKGKAIINSVNGEQKSMDRVFPLVKKYGTSVVALMLDERGIPATTEERIEILDKILSEAAKYGITKDRIIVDNLALTVATDPDAAKNTLGAIEIVTREYGMDTVLGASNISFGLPDRNSINKAFLSLAVFSGLSSVITDPSKPGYIEEIKSAEVLSGRDEFAEKYICYNKQIESAGGEKVAKMPNRDGQISLAQAIRDGRDSKAESATRKLLEDRAPLDIINDIVIPGLEAVGDDYEAGRVFLPQMIKSAEAVKKAFDVLKPIIAKEGKSISKGKIAVATVKGDIHDIGKNIVKTVLENYGYEIIDLGKDVETDIIIDTVKKEDIKFIGLSALMTTTMVNMKPVIDIIQSENIPCKVAVGGAVLTDEYAQSIGADFYCETAMDTVRAAEAVFGS